MSDVTTKSTRIKLFSEDSAETVERRTNEWLDMQGTKVVILDIQYQTCAATPLSQNFSESPKWRHSVMIKYHLVPQ